MMRDLLFTVAAVSCLGWLGVGVRRSSLVTDVVKWQWRRSRAFAFF